MPIVNVNSSLYRATGGRVPDELEVRGRLKRATGVVTNLSTDSQGSRYLLAEIPSHAYLTEATEFAVSAWGYADVRIGTFSDPAALVSALKSAATTQQLAKFGPRTRLPLWQAVGLASDPGGRIRIYAHGSVANATANGSMDFIFEWVEN